MSATQSWFGAAFTRRAAAGKPFTVVGDGTQRRDFIYATDVAAGFLARAGDLGAARRELDTVLAEIEAAGSKGIAVAGDILRLFPAAGSVISLSSSA